MIRTIVLTSCACAALIASPDIAAAQQEVFAEGLSELTGAVAGTFGDEGVRIEPALDKMTSGLAEWDRTIQMFEARLVSELPGAPQSAAFEMRVNLGRMYVKRGRLADALRELDLASLLEPKHADLHVLRGLLLDASGRSKEAGDAFRTAWALDASDPIKAYYVFRHTPASDNTKDVQGSREVLAAAYRRLLLDGARAKPSPFVSVDIQDDAAETPVLPPAIYVEGYARIARGEYVEAIAEFRKAAQIDPLVSDPAARTTSIRQAIAALRQGRVAEARALFADSDRVHDSSEAHRVLGLIDLAESQYDKSIEQLGIAIRRNPRDERARLALFRVLSSAGRDAEAERALLETMQVIPDSALARWWYGWSFERRNQFADARREYGLAVTAVIAGRGKFFASIGRLAMDAGDFEGASEAFTRSVRAGPNDVSAHKYLAGAFLQQDRADEAFVELVAALLIDPLDAGAHAGIGQIYLNAGRYDEAVTALRRAVELSANYTEARYALATALMRLGNTQEASREFERVEQAQRQALAERRRSMSLDVLKEEAALRAADGNYAAAIALYEKALTLGSDAAAYRQLAELYSKVGRVDDASRARAMYERALQGDQASRGTAR